MYVEYHVHCGRTVERVPSGTRFLGLGVPAAAPVRWLLSSPEAGAAADEPTSPGAPAPPFPRGLWQAHRQAGPVRRAVTSWTCTAASEVPSPALLPCMLPEATCASRAGALPSSSSSFTRFSPLVRCHKSPVSSCPGICSWRTKLRRQFWVY